MKISQKTAVRQINLPATRWDTNLEAAKLNVRQNRVPSKGPGVEFGDIKIECPPESVSTSAAGYEFGVYT